MLEILFHGKRIDNGEWVEGFVFDDDLIDSEKMFIGAIVIENNEITGRCFCEVDPSTVGQYTGKVVKTGKVFDGDIGKSIDGIFLVYWDDEKAAFVMRFNEYPYETLYLEEMWDDAEIIGNIHDNPELMEVR